MSIFNGFNGFGANPNDIVAMIAGGGTANYYQGLNPYMVQVGQAQGESMVNQAQFMSAQVAAMTRQQGEQEEIIRLQRQRNLADMIHDEARRDQAYDEIDDRIVKYIGVSEAKTVTKPRR